jgi:hypothetical protein
MFEPKRDEVSGGLMRSSTICTLKEIKDVTGFVWLRIGTYDELMCIR